MTDKKYVWKCDYCEWTGNKDEIEWLPGDLWYYDDHEACPKCWEEHCWDHSVHLEFLDQE